MSLHFDNLKFLMLGAKHQLIKFETVLEYAVKLMTEFYTDQPLKYTQPLKYSFLKTDDFVFNLMFDQFLNSATLGSGPAHNMRILIHFIGHVTMFFIRRANPKLQLLIMKCFSRDKTCKTIFAEIREASNKTYDSFSALIISSYLLKDEGIPSSFLLGHWDYYGKLIMWEDSDIMKCHWPLNLDSETLKATIDSSFDQAQELADDNNINTEKNIRNFFKHYSLFLACRDILFGLKTENKFLRELKNKITSSIDPKN